MSNDEEKEFWLGMLTAFMLVFTMAFSDSASAAQPAKMLKRIILSDLSQE